MAEAPTVLPLVLVDLLANFVIDCENVQAFEFQSLF